MATIILSGAASAAANIALSDFVPTAASAIIFCVPLSFTGKSKKQRYQPSISEHCCCRSGLISSSLVKFFGCLGTFYQDFGFDFSDKTQKARIVLGSTWLH